MYCVNCGVKLAESQKACPLCGTVVCHPDLPCPRGEPMYPRNCLPEPQVSPRGAQIMATALFLIPLLITFLCDLQLSGGITWSGYVIGGLLTAYCVFVLPHWFRRPHPAVFCALDFAAAGLYLQYINHVTAGNWFASFALPLTGGLGALCTLVLVLLRQLPRGRLYVIGGAVTALGAMMLLIELLLCLTFPAVRFYGWSLYPMTALTVLGVALIFLGANRRAREKMERKFFL